jgi:alkyl hydroperoxide reductase subunit F
MFDLIILGGGPAAVGAGVYASRKKMRTLLLTKDFGGQSVNSDRIENFIGQTSVSGLEFAKLLEKQLRLQEHVEIKDNVLVQGIERNGDFWRISDAKGNEYESRTVLIALGSTYRRLGVPGENEYEGKGVFYCSICDAPLLRDKKAAVIGGGNSGLESVIDLLPYASDITLLVRGNELKGDPLYQEKIMREPKVRIMKNVSVAGFSGSVLLEKVFYTENGSSEQKELEAQGAFVNIGQDPNSEIFAQVLERSSSRHIIVDPRTFKTSAQGIWAAGDITDASYNQINTAIGDGIKAVLNIYDTLKKSL